MVRNSREELLDKRMKANNYDDETLEEMRGRIRRINGHRTSSLSDIRDFQKNVDLTTLKGDNESTIFISESTLMELKKKVDESETQKQFMNALKERLKELNQEKDVALKKSNMDQEVIRKKNEEIRILEEENKRLNSDLKELSEILDNYKQRLQELENCNESINILTGTDMQSRIECGTRNGDKDFDTAFSRKSTGGTIVDSNFAKGEIKTLQEELLLNHNSNLSSISSQSLLRENSVAEKEKIKTEVRHVLFNEVTERFVSEKIDEKYKDDINTLKRSMDGCMYENKHEWLNIMVRLSGLVDFKSKMLLMRQFLENEEEELAGNLLLDFSLQEREESLGNVISGHDNTNGSEGNSRIDNNNVNNNRSSQNRRLNNAGYSGPAENKIKIILSPIKAVIGEIVQRMEGNMESFEGIESILLEKKMVLKVLQEQINYLKEKLARCSGISGGNSLNSVNSRVTSFSDLATEREYTYGSGSLSARSSKFSEKLRSNIEHSNSIHRRLLATISRLKLWILEEILYDEYIIESYLYKDVDYNRIIGRYDLNNNEFVVEIEDNESDLINEIENRDKYNSDYGFLNKYKYLSSGIIQMIYVLNKQWERSNLSEKRLLTKLQEMVRIYHRLKSFILTSKNHISNNMLDSQDSIPNANGENLDNSPIDEVADFESLHFTDENNYVLSLEKELTSLGLGILSGRDLSRSSTNKTIACKAENNFSDDKVDSQHGLKVSVVEKSGFDNVLRREQVNEILKRLDKYPDPSVANKNEVLSIRELIRPLKSYGRRAPEPYIGFYTLLTYRLDTDIEQHDREIRAFQKVIKGLEDQCDRQQEELEELHEELEQLYDIIEREDTDNKNSTGVEEKGDEDEDDTGRSNDNLKGRVVELEMSDKEWLSLCRKTSLGQS
ncbi:hypothetical protein FG386_003398 [Cryptosporidium ryanae]|uniref:uncharacterized protein n=1 Tax=Cryptosporidium ryanae TaxID=515981 RepID=UPI00351AABED|nr:hypothetical protein FG386_003398 [Cryptosporidium ryanae]